MSDSIKELINTGRIKKMFEVDEKDAKIGKFFRILLICLGGLVLGYGLFMAFRQIKKVGCLEDDLYDDLMDYYDDEDFSKQFCENAPDEA